MPGDRDRHVDAGNLADLLGRHARRHRVPGAALGLLENGVARTACYGVADVRGRRAVTADTPFSLGSLTKPVVASVLVRLAAAGDLALDDSVAARVPETADCGWAQRATVRDLLANRSGVPLSEDLEFGFDDRPAVDDGALARFAAEIAAVPPTPCSWSYSNAGWCLLGRAVEVAAGTSFEQTVAGHLASAGVDGIAFQVGRRVGGGPVAGRVTGHELSGAEPIAVPALTSRAYAAAGTSATGGLRTLLDFAGWHLADPALAMLRETAADVALPGWLDGWGLGWGRFDWSAGPAWGWDALVNGERSCLRLLPERGAAVVLLANASTGRALARTLLPELVDAAFGITIPRRDLDPTPDVAGDLSGFAGVYAWPDRQIEVTTDGECLHLTEAGHDLVARPVDGRTFLVNAEDPDRPTVTFGAFGDDGRPHVLYDMVWGLPRADARAMD